MPMIQPLKLSRGKTVQAYKVVYQAFNRHQQENWHNHILNPTQRSIPVTYPGECASNYMDWFLKITHPYIQIPNLRTTLQRTHGAQNSGKAKLQFVADKAVSLLDEALLGTQVEDILVLVRNARDMIFNVRKEMSQDKRQEDRRKKTHDPITIASSTTRAPAKEKAPSSAARAPAKRKAPYRATRAPAKEKGPVKERASRIASAKPPTKTKGPARKKAKK